MPENPGSEFTQFPRLWINVKTNNCSWHSVRGTFVCLKGHANEADFLGFFQKLGPHRSLTLPFEPFRFWLQIRGDIRNGKTTPQIGESGSRRLSDSASRGDADSPTRWVGESTTHRLGESGSRYSNFLKFSIDFPDFKRLNHPFKRSIWQKRSQECNVISPLIYLKVWKKLDL